MSKLDTIILQFISPYTGKSMRIELYIIIMKRLIIAVGGMVFLPFSCPERKEGYIREIIIIVKNIGRAIVRMVLRCCGKEAEG